MTYHEFVGNLHMHTPYSDGEATHSEIAEAALTADLDFVVVTDHNVLVQEVQGYYGDDERGHVLLLTGEEVHDRTRLLQSNHCLVYNTHQEMSPFAHDPQKLIDEVDKAGGLSFLAHPFDRRIQWSADSISIAWVDWDIDNFTGLEIWNFMSCFKDVLTSPWQSFRQVFSPEAAVVGPRQETLDQWDKLLSTGRRVVGIGNSDAHGTRYQIGPLKHIIFPYDFLFHCVNTHLLTTTPLTGHTEQDATILYQSLRQGQAFVSYQIVGNARGFRFTAQGAQGASAQMGETIRVGAGITLQAVAPGRGHLKLIRHGEVVAEEEGVENLTYVALAPGAYRVEVWRHYRGQERCWILSNPIYVMNNQA